MAKFLVLTLPRSRSKWMSEFLSFPPLVCGHDLAVECSSIQDFEDALDNVDGSVETGAILGWRLLREKFPKLRLVTVSRSLFEIEASFRKLGIAGVNWEDMAARSEMMTALASQPGVLALSFSDLATERGCCALFEHCLERDFDFEWWLELRDQNIQINMKERLRTLRDNAPGLALLRDEIISETRKLGDSSCNLH